jgi:hypothetical protein
MSCSHNQELANKLLQFREKDPIVQTICKYLEHDCFDTALQIVMTDWDKFRPYPEIAKVLKEMFQASTPPWFVMYLEEDEEDEA